MFLHPWNAERPIVFKHRGNFHSPTILLQPFKSPPAIIVTLSPNATLVNVAETLEKEQLTKSLPIYRFFIFVPLKISFLPTIDFVPSSKTKSVNPLFVNDPKVSTLLGIISFVNAGQSLKPALIREVTLSLIVTLDSSSLLQKGDSNP